LLFLHWVESGLHHVIHVMSSECLDEMGGWEVRLDNHDVQWIDELGWLRVIALGLPRLRIWVEWHLESEIVRAGALIPSFVVPSPHLVGSMAST